MFPDVGASRNDSLNSSETDGERGERTHLGVEIGELGAWIRMVSDPAALHTRWRFSFTAPPSADELIDQLVEGSQTLSGGTGPLGVGVACWGHPASAYSLQREDEQASFWEDELFRHQVSERLGAAIYVRPAVEFAALAEATERAPYSAGPLLYVHLGREVLSCIVTDGTILTGAHGLAGGLGHWSVAPDGPRCACGIQGHLNPLCSSQSIVRMAIGLAAQSDEALREVRAITHDRAESMTAAQVVQLAAREVEPMVVLTRRAASALGRTLGHVALLLDPATIVLGGPLGVAGDPFLAWTRDEMYVALGTVRQERGLPIVISAALEPESALVGAREAARRSAQRPAGE
ncbi:MAG TPA: ROK family protein [Ktedonobacterales bacterium]